GSAGGCACGLSVFARELAATAKAKRNEIANAADDRCRDFVGAGEHGIADRLSGFELALFSLDSGYFIAMNGRQQSNRLEWDLRELGAADACEAGGGAGDAERYLGHALI